MLFFVFILVCVPIAEAFLSSSSSYKSFILRQTLLNSDEVLEEYKQELIALRGTPELVDRLENLASKYPGLEVCYYL